ncbi:MAG TPA: hypothetical protein VMF08_10890 [Candidatus Sulfotelmatobacter sp.]|nr:hypothetical protein [Candidatus Sulfotelmatobacter sp.]
MKTTLTVSLVLNIVLLAGTMILWRHPQVLTISSPATPPAAARVKSEIPPAPVSRTVIAPFRWSQLSSTNGYRAFIANLRAAGCPEATVEDIVRGNTGRAYAMMRQRLGVSAMAPGRWSEQAQMQMAAYLLGQSPVAEEPGAEEAPTALAAAGQNNQSTLKSQTADETLAAFLQNTDFTTPGMTVEQQQEIAGLRQGLLAQIGGASQTPTTGTSQPSQTSTDNSQSSATGDNVQLSGGNDGNGDSSSQSGAANAQSTHPHGSEALIQAANQQSVLAGLFGMGAAMQYNQSQSAQGQQ